MKTKKTYQRQDISDKVWAKLEPLLPGRKGSRGRMAQDKRRFINAVFWILRTGAPWRDLPADYGDWKNTHRRFSRWRDRGVWASILETLASAPDFEWLSIDATHIKVHPHAAGPQMAMKRWPTQKGAQYQTTFSCGCVWEASTGDYYRR